MTVTSASTETVRRLADYTDVTAGRIPASLTRYLRRRQRRIQRKAARA